MNLTVKKKQKPDTNPVSSCKINNKTNQFRNQRDLIGWNIREQLVAPTVVSEMF